MNIVKIRKKLLAGSAMSAQELQSVDIESLCDESLKIFFKYCKILRLNTLAINAGIKIDKVSLPRRGNIVDNRADSFYSLRSARIRNR